MATRRQSRQSPILSKSYRVRARWAHGWARVGSLTEKREAIRLARRILRDRKPGTRPRVEVKTAEGGLIYQAHVNAKGRIVSEEL